eukprot:364514-Chlamydomonas_euryale.AAC.2
MQWGARRVGPGCMLSMYAPSPPGGFGAKSYSQFTYRVKMTDFDPICELAIRRGGKGETRVVEK